jgi:hypothetical protein
MHRIYQVHPQPGSPPYDILQSPFAKNLTGYCVVFHAQP